MRNLRHPVESKHQAEVAVAAISGITIISVVFIVESYDLRRLEAHHEYLPEPDQDHLEEAAKASAAYPGHDTIVERIAGWVRALRRR